MGIGNYLSPILCYTIAVLTHWTDALGIPQNQRELVQQLRAEGHLKSDMIANVMTQVDRKYFVTDSPIYTDTRKELKLRLTTINDTAPHMVAFALETLRNFLVQEEDLRILEVGFGSGYLTMCMAIIAGYTANILAVEQYPRLVNLAINNTNKVIAANNLRGKIARIRFKKIRNMLDLDTEGPFDVIYVTPRVLKEVPELMMDKIKYGGIMVVPVGESEHMHAVSLFFCRDQSPEIVTDRLEKEFIADRVLWYPKDKDYVEGLF